MAFASWSASGDLSKDLILSVARHLGEVDKADVGALKASIVVLSPQGETGVEDGQALEVEHPPVAISPLQLSNTDAKRHR